MDYTAEVLDYVVHKGFSVELGARNIQRTIEEEMLAPLARLAFTPAWKRVGRVEIRLGGGGSRSWSTTTAAEMLPLPDIAPPEPPVPTPGAAPPPKPGPPTPAPAPSLIRDPNNNS